MSELPEPTVVVTDADQRERFLAAAVTALLRERIATDQTGDGQPGAGLIIGIEGMHVAFFTQGDELRMTSVEGGDPMEAPSSRTEHATHGQLMSYRVALFDMAKAYRLGSPESRAIVTAIEHADIVTRAERKSNRSQLATRPKHARGPRSSG